MLHFPSPVKLTGWNATGGLLGRKDERLFFFSPPPPLFFSSPPLPHHLPPPMIPFPCSHSCSLLCLCAGFMLPLCIFLCDLDSYVMRQRSLWCVDVSVQCPGMPGLCWPADSASLPPDSYQTPWSSPCHTTALNYLITLMSSLQAPTQAVCAVCTMLLRISCHMFLLSYAESTPSSI